MPPGATPGADHDGPDRFPNARQLLLVIFSYFVLQTILRAFVSPSADLDESDQLVLTQKLSWGYGPQPPLYTWIQIGVFKLFGLSIFSLAIFKNLLLFATYVLTYLNARFVTRSQMCGIAAAASLLLIPQIAWESQRDLTHSVLASTIAAATLLSFLRLNARRTAGNYIAFGICAGLGLLSKYNYSILLAGLLLAAASLRNVRPALLNPRMLLALAVALLTFAPNGLWILHHRHLALLTASKFGIEHASSWSSGILAGFGKLIVVSFTFLGPLVLIYVLLFWKNPNPGAQHVRTDQEQLIFRTLVAAYGIIVIAILTVGVRDLRERWLQPILVCFPVLAISWMRLRLDRVRLNWLLGIAAVVMTLVAIFIPARIRMAERLHRSEPLNQPFDRLAGLARVPLEASPVVVTDNKLLAGNLRLNLPDRIFTSPELAEIFADGATRYTFAWDATRSLRPPAVLTEFAESAGVRDFTNAVQYFGSTYKFHHIRQMRLGVSAPQEIRR